MDKKIQIFSNCIPVKGFSRSLICDLQRKKYYFIPNDFFIQLQEYDDKISKNLSVIKDNEKPYFEQEYIDFLIENDLAYFVESNDIQHFPKLNLDWAFPSKITNSIISINHKFFHSFDFGSIIEQLDRFNCKAIQLRVYDLLSLDLIKQLLSFFNESRIEAIELFFPFNPDISQDEIKYLFPEFLRLSALYLFNGEKDDLYFADQNKEHPINITKTKIQNDSFCGFISPFSYAKNNNLTFFTESQCHNTCLNRKLCIDQNGEIKNCPAMAKSYGNIKDTALKEVISNPEFQELWTISKDQIDVCQDCEFRHMCMDCRAFIKDPENIYSQPAKCTYNPYICKWDGQDGYIPVEECGTYTIETGFVPDIEKINALNKLIWGEDD